MEFEANDDFLRNVVFDGDIVDSIPNFRAKLKGEGDGDVLENVDIEEQKMIDGIVEKCAHSRVWFAEEVLDIELASWQKKLLVALDDGETRISIVSGNGPGKTMIVSVIGLHYLLFRNDVKVPITSPSSGQLRDGLYPECIKWIKRLPDFLQNQLTYIKDRIYRTDDPENNFISFRTARKETPEALAGIHATYVMCLVDEASGVDDIVYEAAAGTLATSGAIFIMIGNGTRLSGHFFNTHHKLKKRWFTMAISSFDAVKVDQAFVEEMIATYGLDSNQYKIKVLGEFPGSEEDSLIKRADAFAALGRDIVAPYSATRVWGLDVGRGGDNSALLKRQGDVVHAIKQWNIKNLMETVGIVYEEWKTTPVNHRPDAIYVDSIGIGAGVSDRLRELLSGESTAVVDVNVSEVPAMIGMYPRLRDELWYNVKNWLEGASCAFVISDELSRKDGEELVEELSAPIAVYTSSGKNQVESKMQMKARGIASPNIADALCLTFAYLGSIGAGRSSSDVQKWKKPLDYTPAHVH